MASRSHEHPSRSAERGYSRPREPPRPGTPPEARERAAERKRLRTYTVPSRPRRDEEDHASIRGYSHDWPTHAYAQPPTTRAMAMDHLQVRVTPADTDWCYEHKVPVNLLQKHAWVDGARGLYRHYIRFIEWCDSTGVCKAQNRDERWWLLFPR